MCLMGIDRWPVTLWLVVPYYVCMACFDRILTGVVLQPASVPVCANALVELLIKLWGIDRCLSIGSTCRVDPCRRTYIITSNWDDFSFKKKVLKAASYWLENASFPICCSFMNVINRYLSSANGRLKFNKSVVPLVLCQPSQFLSTFLPSPSFLFPSSKFYTSWVHDHTWVRIHVSGWYTSIRARYLQKLMRM